MQIKKLSIKRKIVITSIFILVPIIICICIITFRILTTNLLNSSVNSLIADSKSAQIYIENIIRENKDENIDTIIKDYAPYICNELKERFGFRVQFFDNSNKLIYDTTDNKDILRYYNDINEASNGNKAYTLEKIDGVPYIFISSPIFYDDNTCGVVRFIFKDIQTYTIVRQAFYIVLIVAVVFMLIGIILFYTFAKKITNPLIKLTDYSKKISKGNYEERINIESGDELEVLATTFNEMSENINIYIEEIKKAYKNQKEFFDNISHEFRTPLTSIIGFSYILPKIHDEEQLKESSDCIRQEGERLLDLVNEILAIAKNEKESFQINKEFINIKKILDECVSILKPRFDNYHIIVESNYNIHFVYGDYNKTKQVFLNILDNAIKYSGCEILTINSKNYNDKFEVVIRDDGIGFDTSNPISEKSTGFGLNICKDIMKNQNGDFYVESEMYSGTVCKITFYKYYSK
ncbi:HAMP domain-containing sensor histidine kinase [Clostridium sp. Ade.TY]|uniref:HAMP domain-containing sensor histidine kinase n=1 Tax=Clostridium sp. Ade.TY TaxID=1391647 RepID=UPI00040BA4AC|nr:HAMP domain-containing sensor histidine kinase [Clostridium sp. Ade.TY]